MIYNINVRHLSFSHFCEITKEDGSMPYHVESHKLTSEYDVYRGESKIYLIEQRAERFGMDDEITDVFTTLYEGNSQIASITSSSNIFTKESYTIDGFNFTISSNFAGNSFEIKDSDKKLLATANKSIFGGYTLNVLGSNDEDVILALLMVIIRKHNSPGLTGTLFSMAIDNIVKKD